MRVDCIGHKVPKYQNTLIVVYRNSTGNNILDCGTFIWAVLLLETELFNIRDFGMFTHIDVEAGLQSLKSTIAETGMGVTSRP